MIHVNVHKYSGIVLGVQMGMCIVCMIERKKNNRGRTKTHSSSIPLSLSLSLSLSQRPPPCASFHGQPTIRR